MITSIYGAIITTFDGGCTKVYKYMERYIEEYITFLEKNDDDYLYENDKTNKSFLKNSHNQDLISKSEEFGMAITEDEIEMQFETIKTVLNNSF